MKRQLTYLYHISIFFVIVAGLVGCVDIESEGELAEDELRWGLPSQEFEDVILTHSKSGEILFKLTAPHFDRYDRKDKALFYGGIEILFYEDGEVTSRLTSERGEVLHDGEELIALGNVVVETDTGTTILTPRLRWEKETKLITNDTTVTIITDYDTLYGTGLIATDDLKNKRIINPTGVSYRGVSEEGGGMQLSPARSDDETRADSSVVNPQPRSSRSETMSVVGPSGISNIDNRPVSPFDKPQLPEISDSTNVDTSASTKETGE
ncbi:lipopolysaccharide-assembly, LptC-related [bacterium BMS3Bbin04]|nr:lipopolysaccharide-assembly, LptC-related [bacterium BMS3Bbin04]